MNYLDLLPYDYVSKYGEEGEDGRKRGFAIDDPEWNVIDFQSVCKVANAGAAFVCMGDYDYFVTTVYELCRKLVYVGFNSSGLGEEEIADHTTCPVSSMGVSSSSDTNAILCGMVAMR